MTKPHSEFADEHLEELHKELHATDEPAEEALTDPKRILGHLIKEVPPHAAVYVLPSTPVAEAIHMMIVRRTGCVVVQENDELRGIFTERDVLLKVFESGKDTRKTPVAEFMTPNPETLR